MSREPLCPVCPVCGQPPAWIFESMGTTFCINEECKVLTWDPWVSAYDNLKESSEISITEIPHD